MKQLAHAVTLTLATSASLAAQETNTYIAPVSIDGCTSDNHLIVLFATASSSTSGQGEFVNEFVESGMGAVQTARTDFDKFLSSMTFQQAVVEPRINEDENGLPTGGIVDFIKDSLPTHFETFANDFANSIPQNVELTDFQYDLNGIDFSDGPDLLNCLNEDDSPAPGV
ncbi:MAG: hypothetical protein ACRBCT_03725 [Alphaproteobacteria bacterium]